jgi:tyrosinase
LLLTEALTFPTWHRPYLALFEQTLASYFPEIIQEISAKNHAFGNSLNQASKTWRLPYWDWCLYPKIPEEFSLKEIYLYQDGDLKKLPNPLQGYKFKTGPILGPWATTIRQPSNDDPPVSQPDVVNGKLGSEQLKTLVMQLFPQPLYTITPWYHFSNSNWDKVHREQGHLTSIEHIHDIIHGDVGGSGHMGYTSVAAFDPIFWVHHCQVDRLFALWQAAYPNVYFTDSGISIYRCPKSWLTVGLDPKISNGITKDKDLHPFWDTEKSLVTSATCQFTKKYNYTYPELATPNGISPDKAYEKVSALYGGGHWPTFFLREANRAATESQAATVASNTPPQSIIDDSHIDLPSSGLKPRSSVPHQRVVTAPPSLSQTMEQDHEPTLDTYQEWVVNITVEKFALRGPGYVIVFLGPEGDIPANEAEWQTCPLYVGSVYIFTADPDITGCENCKQQEESGMRIGGSVYLTNTLIEKRVPLVGQAVVDYLKENLHWRVKDSDGNEREEVPSLKVLH